MSPRPIFIVGSGRSGTSVLTWSLGQHPNIAVTPETNWLSALASHMEGYHEIGRATNTSHFSQLSVTESVFFEGLGYGVDRVVKRAFERWCSDNEQPVKPTNGMAWRRDVMEPKARWVDGTPSNTPYVSILALMFPEAKFINLVRHPDEVFESWAGISWREKVHKNPRNLLNHIYRSQKAGYLVESAYKDRAVRVDYRELTGSPDATMKRLCKFVGEEFVPAVAEPLKAGKINSSGGGKPQTQKELALINSDKRLQEMREWYEFAGDETWVMRNDAVDAVTELEQFAKQQILIPKKSEPHKLLRAFDYRKIWLALGNK